MLHSSVWQESVSTKLMWVTLLLMANRDGEVRAAIPGLANAAGIPIAECEAAMATFMAPDPYSQSQEYGGQRVKHENGVWVILNYSHYRGLESAEEARVKGAARVAKHRALKALGLLPGVANVTNNKSNPIAEAEAEAEAEKEKTLGLAPDLRRIENTARFVAQNATSTPIKVKKVREKAGRAARSTMKLDWLPQSGILSEITDAGFDSQAILDDFRAFWANDGKLGANWDAAFANNWRKIQRTEYLAERFRAVIQAAPPKPAKVYGPPAPAPPESLAARIGAMAKDNVAPTVSKAGGK